MKAIGLQSYRCFMRNFTSLWFLLLYKGNAHVLHNQTLVRLFFPQYSDAEFLLFYSILEFIA